MLILFWIFLQKFDGFLDLNQLYIQLEFGPLFHNY